MFGLKSFMKFLRNIFLLHTDLSNAARKKSSKITKAASGSHDSSSSVSENLQCREQNMIRNRNIRINTEYL